MLRVTALAMVVGLLASAVWAGETPTDKKANSPEALKAEIEALIPAKHVWRAIHWKTCPLEALKASREQNKPVITWVFLGVPTDERC
ncbi:MAG: hypothetical protein EXR99_16480 [Gemmataceae bacterium]|nr:hypothetical protein [Gemmataceae bacterium]